jgi:hypothetical protein
VSDAPLSKPDHLRPEAERGDWLARNVAAAVTLALGTIAFVVVAVTQDQLWSTPDWRISVPGFVVTAIAAAASIARRERAYPVWLLGLALAATSLVLGWFLMLAVVIGATAVLILILHSVM